MKTWANRIMMSDDVAKLLTENKTDEIVGFTYINIKNNKEKTTQFPLKKAIKLAEERINDKRYKNFEIYIG